MEGDFIKINEWLTPLSWLYGIGVRIRNLMFDMGLRKSRSFKTPVICVGNITVGGTGKTPHVEYLIRLLQDKADVAVLSRGYKRKSKGFLIADDSTAMRDIGDEPYQMKLKFPNATIAVDNRRVHGILQLTGGDDKSGIADVILLDDAFQHRQVKAGINILLVDYHRLIVYDRLLPAGRLREPLTAKNRADIVIVTKCPNELKPMEYRVITKTMNLFPYQQLYFSTLEYESPKPVFKECQKLGNDSSAVLMGCNVLLLTGIASPRQLIDDLRPQVKSLTPLTFSDHHDFSRRDIRAINSAFDSMPSPKCIITTEKDAARLTAAEGLSDDVRHHLHCLPVRISFLQDQQEMFDRNIVEYVQKNSRRLLSMLKEKDKKEKSHRKAHAANGASRHTISFK